jgi:hypothetical protein
MFYQLKDKKKKKMTNKVSFDFKDLNVNYPILHSQVYSEFESFNPGKAVSTLVLCRMCYL